MTDVADFNYWQIAAGAFVRDYTQDFIRYGLAFVGGQEQTDRMREVAINDRIILKYGMKMFAVGRVVEREGRHKGEDDKEWLRDFDGWDLHAYCHVEWHELERSKRVKGLTRATINRVHIQRLQDIAEQVLSTVPAQEILDPEPSPTRLVDDQEILRFLIQQGLRPSAAEDLTATFNRIRLLAQYYYDLGEWQDLREHETRTFLVIPLLLALGWAEQQIKIELPVKGGKRADVACFSKPYTKKSKDKCVLIIETKGFSQGLDYARDQVKQYAKHLPNTKSVVVTNGYCYKAFAKQEDGSFADRPSAYLNLRDPRDAYPLNPDNVKGCLEALRLLSPMSYT